MKALLRSTAVQATLGFLLGAYIYVMQKTVRWRYENLECLAPMMASEGGALGLLWHGRIPLCMAIEPHWRPKGPRAMISPSADGEFIARALAMNRCPAIRISSAKKGDANKARQAVAALRAAVTWVADGGVLIVTPDGPRGPNEVIAEGSLQIAKRSGQPIYLLGVASSPSIQLNSWDRIMFGLPFGRGAVVYDGPHYIPADADKAEIDAQITELSARLSAATRRAETLVGRTSH